MVIQSLHSNGKHRYRHDKQKVASFPPIEVLRVRNFTQIVHTYKQNNGGLI